jgi:hypothetical protein
MQQYGYGRKPPEGFPLKRSLLQDMSGNPRFRFMCNGEQRLKVIEPE